eukprot:GHVL01027517.1.p1 GENE.GHVL01027517.1~~GHVL01027517.1.p1  ORF type:complete len:421 (-),score=58.11 GHVL01027517.1:1065-2327(-)
MTISKAISVLIVVFSRQGCKHCKKAKTLLTDRGIPYSIVDVEAEPSRKQESATRANGSTTVPQIFFNGSHVGGASELEELDKKGLLMQRIHDLEELDPMHYVIIPPTPESLLPKENDFPLWDDKLEKQREALIVAAKKGHIPKPLNTLIPPLGMKRDARQLGEALRNAMSLLSDKFFKDGGVDYEAMAVSVEWQKFQCLVHELQDCQGLPEMSECARRAFFINVYNTMTFHGITTFGSPSSLIKRYQFFKSGKVSWLIAGHVLTNDDVENGILRNGNQFFKKCDERAKLKCSLDPRIHFALNCGARSCPPVGVFSAERLNEELDLATSAFLGDDNNLQVMESSVKLSKILKWYETDFTEGGNQSKLIDWLIDHAPKEKSDKLRELKKQGKFHISYHEYDWGTNSKSGKPVEGNEHSCHIM